MRAGTLTLPRPAHMGAVLAAVLAAACGPGAPHTLVPGGDPARGRTAIALYGCGSCHAIDGITGARGRVGPPLTGVAERTMIAGEVPNTPEMIVRWIRNPQAIEPGTAMPNLGVDERTARDIAAYLYTLR